MYQNAFDAVKTACKRGDHSCVGWKASIGMWVVYDPRNGVEAGVEPEILCRGAAALPLNEEGAKICVELIRKNQAVASVNDFSVTLLDVYPVH